MMIPLPTAVLVALTALTQGPPAPAEDHLEVRALRVDDAGATVLAEDVDVAVFLLDRSGRSAAGTTGDDGIAHVSMERVEGVRYRAVVRQDDGLTFTSPPFTADSPIEQRTVSILPTRQDAAEVEIAELLTLASAHEGYVVFEQAFVFSNDAPFVVQPDAPPGDPERWGVDIVLPEGAEGIVVDAPTNREFFQVGDSSVRYYGPIGPAGSVLDHRWHLVVRYSLERPGAAHRFEQALGMPVRNATVVAALETPFERNPRVDISLMVPPCGASVPENIVCFEDFATTGGAFEVLGGVERRAIEGGRASGEAVLRFDTLGWPSPPRDVQWAVAIASVIVVIGGLGMWLAAGRREHHSPATGARAKRLEARREHLLDQLLDLRNAHEAGEIPQSEFELQDLALRARLERVLKELLGEPQRAA